jgi:signal transduction histidine kinase
MVWRLRVRQVRSKYSLILVERSRMAREIHDTLLQSLLGVMLRLGEVEQTVEESTESARQQLARLRQQLEFYIREARQSIRDLRSPILQTRDLGTALRETGERLTAGRVSFAYDASGPARRAPAKVEEHVLRIAQEAIANALRHATPETVTVNLTYTSDSLALRVADDGAGFDPESLLAETDTHWGLMSMQERAAQIEGRFTLQSQPGAGTAIELQVPLPQS